MEINEAGSFFVGALISFILEVSPMVNVWWGNLTGIKRGYISTLLMVIVTVAITAYQCYRGNACPTDWVSYAATALVYVLAGGAVAFKGVGKPYRAYLAGKQAEDDKSE